TRYDQKSNIFYYEHELFLQFIISILYHHIDFLLSWLCLPFELATNKPAGNTDPKRASIIVIDVLFWNIIHVHLNDSFSNYDKFITNPVDVTYIIIVASYYMLVNYFLPGNIQCFSRLLSAYLKPRFLCHQRYK